MPAPSAVPTIVLVHISDGTRIAFAAAAAFAALGVLCGGQQALPITNRRVAIVIGLLTAALVMLACGDHYRSGDERHRSDVVPIAFFEWQPHPSDATIADAEELLGLELSTDVYRNGEGAVFLVHGEQTGKHAGETEVVDRCSPIVWVDDDPVALAHELGHALGLEHTDDPGNLMYPVWHGGLELTDTQIDFMRWDAWYLQHRC